LVPSAYYHPSSSLAADNPLDIFVRTMRHKQSSPLPRYTRPLSRCVPESRKYRGNRRAGRRGLLCCCPYSRDYYHVNLCLSHPWRGCACSKSDPCNVFAHICPLNDGFLTSFGWSGRLQFFVFPSSSSVWWCLFQACCCSLRSFEGENRFSISY